MASALGWLDTDSAQRAKMLEILDLFKEAGTVDELGIGAIRDALSDALFPGTSVIHTRLRYVLFIPWLLQQAGHKSTTDEMTREFRRLEVKLIESLLAGGDSLGVIGNRARWRLQRMPSGIYWSALGSWDICDIDSVEAFFRRQYDSRMLARRTTIADDPEAREAPARTGLDPHLPDAPTNLLKSTSLSLTAEEEGYLSDQIARSTSGTMLSWLITHPPSADAAFVWEVDNLSSAPPHLVTLVDHARKFSVAIHGATLLYNLLLAEKANRSSLQDRYRDQLRQWRAELETSNVLADWDRADWWATIQRQNSRLSPLTRRFVDEWLDLASSRVDVAASVAARDLVALRERRIKGGRARLVNQSALDRWQGGSGTSRHDFRWATAKSHLNDLYSARVSI